MDKKKFLLNNLLFSVPKLCVEESYFMPGFIYGQHLLIPCFLSPCYFPTALVIIIVNGDLEILYASVMKIEVL